MTEDQLIVLIREALDDGLTSNLWFLILSIACASAIGAFAGWYLKKKAELAAMDEQFQKTLLQLEAQTRTIESIKADVTKDLTASVEDLKDQLQRQSEIHAFRYTRIFTALEEIGKLPAIDYTYLRRDGERFVQDKALFGKVVEQATTRYGQIREIYERVRPLVDEPLLNDVDQSIAEAERQSNLLAHALYTNSDLPDGVDVATLLDARRKVEEAVRELLSRQVTMLTALTA